MKISRMCGILYKIRNKLTTEALISIYYTICYPHIIYCISVWASTWPSFITKLKIAQNKVLRCIFFKGKYDSTDNIYLEYRLLNIFSIHKYFLLLSIFRNITNAQGTTIFHLSHSIHNTRSICVNLICPQFRTTLFKNSIFYLGPQIWNTLPNDVKNILMSGSLNQFKKKIKKHLFALQNM